MRPRPAGMADARSTAIDDADPDDRAAQPALRHRVRCARGHMRMIRFVPLRRRVRDSIARFTRDARATVLIEMAFAIPRSEEHTSELQSLMRISYAVFCLKKKKTK